MQKLRICLFYSKFKRIYRKNIARISTNTHRYERTAIQRSEECWIFCRLLRTLKIQNRYPQSKSQNSKSEIEILQSKSKLELRKSSLGLKVKTKMNKNRDSDFGSLESKFLKSES